MIVILLACALSSSLSAGSGFMGGFFPDTKPYVKKKFKLEKLKDAMKDFVKAEADRKAKDVKVVEEGRADDYNEEGSQERIDDRIRELNKKLPMFIWCQTTHEDLKEYRDESEKTRDLVDDIIREMNVDSTYSRDNVCLQAIEKKPYHRTLQNNPVVATSTLQLDPWEVPEDYEDDAAFGFWNFFYGKKPPAMCDASTPPTNGAVGDCTDKLASGSSCQPTCNDGFDVDGATLCVAGVLNPAKCIEISDDSEDEGEDGDGADDGNGNGDGADDGNGDGADDATE